jgi:hypothetical protein
MTSKSPLERDIESREMIKLPFSALILIALLSIGLGVLGVYAYKLKHELILERQECAIAKDSSDKRITYLLNKVGRLEKEADERENMSEEDASEE